MNKLAIFAALLLLTSPALASPREDLESTQKEMALSQKKQQALAEQTHKLEADLKSLQEKLVKSADALQKSEADVSDAEDKLHILDEQLNVKAEELKLRQKNLSALVRAALSLSHTPPEAMIMMPGDISQTMKAGRALKMASDGIRQETQSIGLQLSELKKLKAKVAKNRDALTQKRQQLTTERKELEQKIAERTSLQEKLGHQQVETKERLSKLAKKAEDLQSLVSSLEKDEAEKQKAEQKTRKDHMRSFEGARGFIKSPARGEVIETFGASQGNNSTSKGITIDTRTGAQVTAPYDGEVVFTGPFLNYGQMVIIRHSGDFHTLLAGLGKIDTSVGQFLLEGEPIGAMGESESATHLYVELRKNNQPVNPTQWIQGLNKKN
jgi:septal ring factor EnvC (AmiA/AmiB activator)